MEKTVIFVAAVVFSFSMYSFAEQYPMLEDVRQVSVTIDHAGVEPNAPPIGWAAIQTQITDRLNKAGIKVVPRFPGYVAGQLPNNPDLRITVMMLSMPETEQFVFHIETSLHRLVSVVEKSNVQFSAPVWTSSVTMQSAPVDDINDAITKAAMRQVELFINAHHIAVIKPAEHIDANTPKKSAGHGLAPLPSTAVSPAAATPQTYIASKSGKVFHLAKCSAVSTISPENVVSFATRDEAAGSGRRPCKKCNP